MPQKISQLIDILPNKPGVYQFLNAQSDVIYIGKAKDLKKRVSSYFNRNRYESAKLRVLISRIADIKHIIVNTESDALLLENNLIKKFKPKYNVLLKDDKTYPWICIKNEPFPRVFSTRRIVNDGSRYFGPYTSGVLMKTILELIRSLYPLRNCNLSLTQEFILSGKYKPCLELQLGNCKAPCISKQTEKEYNENIESIIEILNGNLHKVNRLLLNKMNESAKKFKFEQAQNYKDKIAALKRFQAKSTIVNPKLNDLDVFSLVSEPHFACVNYLKIIKGAVVQSHNLEIKKVLNELDEELLGFAISELRQRIGSKSKDIIVPLLPDFTIEGCNYIVPYKGDKLKLLDLSRRNAKGYVLERLDSIKNQDPQKKTNRILSRMKLDLRLSNLPKHIECFDNSNLQGTNPVAACVVFRNAKPSKKEYRHFNIKTVSGPDDYASMEEIVYRRYKRMIEENQSLPQLVIIDGGKGQLTSAYKSIKKLNIEQEVKIIGIAKRLEKIFLPGEPLPLYLDKTSESLKTIQNARNEAHRFGLRFHRHKREDVLKASSLIKIDGIGEKTIELLYRHFKSYERIINAKQEELELIISPQRATKIFKYFNSNNLKRK
jgi:excinuclease ABC subunit C